MIWLLAWLYGFLFREKEPEVRNEERIRERLEKWKAIQRKRVR